MARVINAVFLILLTPLPAVARRVRYLEPVSLKTDPVEDGKKDAIQGPKKISLNSDKLDLQAGRFEDAGEEQGAAAKTPTQEVQWGGRSINLVTAHNATQGTGDAVAEFSAAVKVACYSIYADAKAATRAELYKNMDPGSNKTRESKQEADTAAAMLIDAETKLWEKTETLAGEAFGGEAIVKCLLEDYVPDNEKTVERLLGRLHTQVEQLQIEKLGFHPEDVVGVERLLSRLSALDAQVEAMNGEESDSEEIDLTEPLLLETTAMYVETVKLMIEYIKVQLDLMRKIVIKKNSKAVEGSKLPETNQNLLLLRFLKAVEKIERRMEIEGVIKTAILEFVNAKVPKPADYKLAEEKLERAVKEVMERLETFDPRMKESQKAKIDNAKKVKLEQAVGEAEKNVAEKELAVANLRH